MKKVSFNSHNSRHFISDYNKARSGQKETFLFEGNEYVIGYAYYLIQHLVNEKIIAGTFDENKIFKINFKPQDN